MKRCMPSLAMICCAVFFSGPASLVLRAQTSDYMLPELILRAKVRDFKEVNPTDTVGVDSQFNNQNGCDAQSLGVNTVEAAIDTTNSADGGAYPGDNRGPKLLDPLPSAMARCYDPPARFSEWYQDKPGVNRSFLVDLRFKRDSAAGLYRFRDDAFFPIDSGKLFAKFNPADPNPFGNLQTGIVDGKDLSKHDYGFTMEFHTDFIYTQGKKQVFTFRGDDDIWVFLNGKRVVDLGGVHQTDSASVNLDSSMVDLGLVDGKTYPFDFFFAERHTASSTCMITTNLALGTTIPVTAPPVAGPVGNTVTDFPARINLSSPTPDAKIYFTLDGSAPDSTKNLYTGPVLVDNGTTLKAIAYRSGLYPSLVLTEGYGSALAIRNPSQRFQRPGRDAAVALYDRSGRLVRIVPPATNASGGTWEAVDLRGTGTARGVYFWKTLPADKTQAASGILLLP